MLKILIASLIAVVGALLVIISLHGRGDETISGAPPYGIPENEVPRDVWGWSNWQRPDVPAKVALQVGHWKNDEVPEELKNLRKNTGSYGKGKMEWEVNFVIAELTAEILRSEAGIDVEILPTTVPKDYWADVFLAIHADGNESASKRGYKFAPPWRDMSGKAEKLVSKLNQSYGQSTGLPLDSNISRNMRGYYAFAWWRYEHAVHPMTTAVIAETGFLTNPQDQKIIVDAPEIAARGLAGGIISFLTDEGLMD